MERSLLDEVGAGIDAPNAMKVLKFRKRWLKTGFARKLSKRAWDYPARTIHYSAGRHSRQGRYLYHRDFCRAGKSIRAGAVWAIFVFDVNVMGYAQNADGVTVHMANGSGLHGDVLIGSDGIHSTVREAMLGEEQPVFTGNVAWRTLCR